MNSSQYIVRFLCSFFEIFRAYIVEIKVYTNRADGKIIFDDGEKQKFVWHFSDSNYIMKSILLLDILLQKRWIHNDQIITSKQELINFLKLEYWEESEIIKVIDYTCNIQIFMIDEGEETDSFFIHF